MNDVNHLVALGTKVKKLNDSRVLSPRLSHRLNTIKRMKLIAANDTKLEPQKR